MRIYLDLMCGCETNINEITRTSWAFDFSFHPLSLVISKQNLSLSSASLPLSPTPTHPLSIKRDQFYINIKTSLVDYILYYINSASTVPLCCRPQAVRSTLSQPVVSLSYANHTL